MEYYLDTARIADIKHCSEFYPLSGVTTNPSLIARENRDFWTILKDIRDVIGPDRMLFAQTVQKSADGIVEEAKLLNERAGGKFGVKIPIGEEGLKATMALKKQDIRVLMTAIFTPAQALIAARAGADYVAPYVNRLDNVSGDGAGVVAEIAELYELYDLPCRVLAASFKNVEQVARCAAAGCHCVTLSADLLKAVISHPMTDAAVAGFERDWKSVYGEKTVMEL